MRLKELVRPPISSLPLMGSSWMSSSPRLTRSAMAESATDRTDHDEIEGGINGDEA